jgi:hydroxymethylbilane synthase
VTLGARALRIASRGSPLARWQADHIAALLRAADADLEVEVVLVDTMADRRLDLPIAEIGGKGVFAKEVQAAVLDGHADLAVHSAKDLPSITHPELALAAVPERGDPRDALVGCTLDALPDGARVGTGSLRRQVQLAHRRPDLVFEGLRGNMGTRLAKAADFDAIVVAAVAFERLGWADRLTEVLDAAVMVPQVGQGALAVECRADDEPLLHLLAAIEHEPSRRAVDAERGFLAELGGDCDLPAGAHATVAADGTVHLDALLASPDGVTVLRHASTGDDPGPLGARAAQHLLTHGGSELLGEPRQE